MVVLSIKRKILGSTSTYVEYNFNYRLPLALRKIVCIDVKKYAFCAQHSQILSALMLSVSSGQQESFFRRYTAALPSQTPHSIQPLGSCRSCGSYVMWRTFDRRPWAGNDAFSSLCTLSADRFLHFLTINLVPSLEQHPFRRLPKSHRPGVHFQSQGP